MSGHILVRQSAEPHVGELVINRPDRHNAITAAMAADFCEALTTLEQDDAVKVIVISGAGEDFTVGADPAELVARFGRAPGAPKPRPLNQRARFSAAEGWWGPAGLFARVLHCPKITIAAAKGRCLEAGLYFALYCDLTVAAESARFGNPVWRHIGVNGDISMLVAAVGLKRAKELIYCGTQWDAATALSHGLIDAVAETSGHEAAVAGLARVCAMIMRDAIAAEKRIVVASLARMQIDTGLAAAAVVAGWGTNIHFRDGEFNFLREAGKNGIDEALRAGLRHFEEPR